jgi:hypothetical protein
LRSLQQKGIHSSFAVKSNIVLKNAILIDEMSVQWLWIS